MAYEQQTIEDLSINPTAIERIADTKAAGWEHWVGDIPVLPQVRELVDKLSASCPDFKFHASNGHHVWYSDNDKFRSSVLVWRSMHVFLDDCPFNVGVVGYGDYRVKRVGSLKEQYMVYSRLIRNNKFADWRDQHRMKLNDNADKLIKECLRYLTPYTTQEIAKACFAPLHSNIEQRVQKLNDDVYDLIRPIVNDRRAVIAELRNLMKEGVKFKHSAFVRFAEQIEELDVLVKEEEAKQVHAKFVRLRTVGDTQFADVADIMDIKKSSRGEPRFASQPTTIPADQLPEDIVGKVSVLNILNNGQYVADIGMKVNSNTFFVEVVNGVNI